MEQLVSPLGLTPEMVAAEARTKLFQLIQESPSEYTTEKKELWREGAAVLFVIANQVQDGKQVSASRVAHEFAKQVDKDSKTKISPLIWEAVTRFALNLIHAGADFDPSEGDTRDELQAELAHARTFDWQGWLETQLKKGTPS